MPGLKRKRTEEANIEDPFNEPITDSLKKPKTDASDKIKESARKAYQILSQNKINEFIKSRETEQTNDDVDDLDTVISEHFTKDTSNASNVSEDLESAASSEASEASEASEVKTVFTQMTRLSKMSWDSTIDVTGDNDKQLITVMDSFQRTKQEFGEGNDYENTLNDELKDILQTYLPKNDESNVDMMTRLTNRSMTTIKNHYKNVFGEYGIIFNKYKRDYSALHEAFFPRLFSGKLSGTGIDKNILKISLVSDLNRWASCVTFLSWRKNIPFF